MSDAATISKPRMFDDTFIKSELVPDLLMALTFQSETNPFCIREGDADFAVSILKQTYAHCCIQLKPEQNTDGEWFIKGKPMQEASQEEMDAHWEEMAELQAAAA